MFTFPGQRENEDVLAVIHKHTVVYAKLLTIFSIVVIFPLIIFLYLWFKAYPLDDFYTRGMIAIIFSCVLFLYGLLFLIIAWIDEQFDVFVITSDRLIDVTQITFLKRSVTSTPLGQIQDITCSVKGLMPTILHYGDLTVQTAAGDASDIFMDHVSDPETISRKILDWAHQKREGRKVETP